MAYKIKNLAFCGGGVKGIAYGGVAKSLEENGVSKIIERVAGSSAGSIMAVAVALNLPAEKIEQILLNLDFNKFQDGKWGIISQITTIVSENALYSGKTFYQFCLDLVESITGNPYYTFADLERDKADKGYKDLYITGTNLNKQNLEIFSYETEPDMPIALAMRISGSIPLYFSSINYKGSHYVDGGVCDNYPIHIFDQEVFSSNIVNNIGKNPETLGFAFIDGRLLEAFENETTPPMIMSTDTNWDMNKAILNILLDGQQNQVLKEENDRTVMLDSKGVSAINFNLTQEEKISLINSGYEATNKFLGNHFVAAEFDVDVMGNAQMHLVA